MATAKSETVSLHLFKQNFKFSSAHFLIFDEHRAEQLHGHNYRVKVSLRFRQNLDYSKLGFTIDFGSLKQQIIKVLNLWDEHVLLPEEHPDMRLKVNGPSLEVRFRDRYYVFPKTEVVCLPITNTSVENLSRLLANQILDKLKTKDLQSLSVYVEETPGQGASTEIKAE